jgi:NADPH2:quinone reductase
MQTVRCNGFGEPEELVVAETDPGPLANDRVRVRVTACGVNFVDALMVQGKYQIKPALPFTPGTELAGVILEVGNEVEGWEPGQRVAASCGLGGYTSMIDLQPGQLVAIPDNISDAQAATLGQSYATAWFSLGRRIKAAPGEWILVLGAAGGVGLATIDVARAMGMNVIAAASSAEKLDLCIRKGAHEVINYSTEDLKVRAREISDGGVDVAVDPVGGELTGLALRSLGDFGRLIIIGFAAGDIESLPANQVLLRNRAVIGVDWGIWSLTHPAENAGLMAEVVGALSDGTLNPVEPETRALADAGPVLRSLLERQVIGKVALIP